MKPTKKPAKPKKKTIAVKAWGLFYAGQKAPLETHGGEYELVDVRQYAGLKFPRAIVREVTISYTIPGARNAK